PIRHLGKLLRRISVEQTQGVQNPPFFEDPIINPAEFEAEQPEKLPPVKSAIGVALFMLDEKIAHPYPGLSGGESAF
ncbi:MAG: hypothetical protein ACE5EY_17165, partial [Anaerolineae bacterium]